MLASKLRLALSCFALPLVLAASSAFENSVITRTVDLGGSTSLVTTVYNVKAIDADAKFYELALGAADELEPSWWEVVASGKSLEGLQVSGGDGRSAPVVSIPTPVTTFTLTHIVVHPSRPLPTSISQDDPQYMLFETNRTWVESVYPTKKETIKIRAPGKILSYSKPSDKFTRDSTAVQKNSLLTLGPYYSVPATLSSSSSSSRGAVALEDFQQHPLTVHYPTTEPVLSIRKYRRQVEVSHWGGNMNIEDDIALVNDGPRLKGFFSRITFQMSRFRPAYPAQILRELTLGLPPSSYKPYYYDIIGNVSTSHFRPSRDGKTAKALLQLTPRYPVLGGWNYTFTVGWDMPLAGYLKNAADGHARKVLSVPFLTGLKDVAVDEAEVSVILPEGARDVEVFTPFKVDSIEHSIHKTYLDSTGRPKVTMKKKNCTERHDQLIYVTYTYPFWAILQKPVAVAAVCGGLFVLAGILRRLDMRLSKAVKTA